MHPSEADLSASYRDGMGRFATDSGGEFRSFPGVTCFRSPVPFLLFNMAFVEDAPSVDSDVLHALQTHYAGTRTEWCLVVPPRSRDTFDIAAAALAISSREVIPEMILSRDSARDEPTPSGLEVRPVRRIEDLREWVHVAAIAFEVGNPRLFAPLVGKAALDGSGMRHYLGFVDGQPVATSSLYMRDRVAGIHAVGTLPESRNRGYGAALCWAAVREGFSRGCNVAALQATPSGFPVYLRMGFRRVFDFEEWVIPTRSRKAAVE